MACTLPGNLKLTHPKYDYKTGGNIYNIPLNCGKCYDCIKRRIQQWAFRLDMENKRSISALFVTLTYDTMTVPLTSKLNMTLRKKDVQDFMKRLRYYHKNHDLVRSELQLIEQGKYQKRKPIKYYAVGEYGEQYGRPHYHIIIFNALQELIYLAWQITEEVAGRCREQIKEEYGNVKKIKIGEIHIDNANKNTIFYTLKYMEKKQSPKMRYDPERVKEFSLQSKGLGENYIDKATIEWHKADKSRQYLTCGKHKIAMPKYYRKRIYTDQERNELLGFIKNNVEQEYRNQEDQDIRNGHDPEKMRNMRKTAKQDKKNNSQKGRKF